MRTEPIWTSCRRTQRRSSPVCTGGGGHPWLALPLLAFGDARVRGRSGIAAPQCNQGSATTASEISRKLPRECAIVNREVPLGAVYR